MNTLNSGKLLLIVITVTVATGGFILGYFVGKNDFQPPPFPAPQGAVSQENQPGTPAGSPGTPSLRDKAIQEKQQASSESRPAVAETYPTQLPPDITASSQRPVQPISEKSVSEEPPGQGQKKALYTVQAGAFKSHKEALVLKRKLESKGYSPLLREETTTRGVKLFKIQIGEFNGKKEASTFALELRQSDGLKAFAVEN